MNTTAVSYDRKQRKILVVDDSQVNLMLLKVHLERMGLQPLLAENAKDAIKLAQEHLPSVILLDVMMPDIDGYETCKKLKSDPQTANIPVIFLSAKDQTVDKITGLQLGAVDYITKPFDPGEFKARLGLILQMVSLQEQLISRANTDELTSLINRRHFSEILEREVLRANNDHNHLSLVMLDIDHFKSFNDIYGHLGGDAVLRQVAEVFRNNVAPLDIVARFGGEEFVVIMPKTPLDKAVAAAEKLRKIIAECRWKISAEAVTVTVSMGVANIDGIRHCSPEELIKTADTALYIAKRRGRNRTVSAAEIERSNTNSDQDCIMARFTQQISKLSQQLRVQAIKVIGNFGDNSPQSLAIAEHSHNVGAYALAIAQQFNLDDTFIDELTTAADFHDIGKLIIEKDPQTYSQQQHPELAIKIIEPVGIFQRELQFVQHHHENFDGSGYPDKLQGRNIPFGARILAVANAVDNIVRTTPDQNPIDLDSVIKQISQHCGTRFDPDVVDAFIKAANQQQDNWPITTQKVAFLIS
ncbi:MAG: diguanylate cyclase [Sedimentisphaerales bacterium]|nr:diguanylate cyclase [Sedimentisphaerales bacterium]